MNAAKVHFEEPKAISAFAAGMTIIFSQGDYSATVFLSHTYWSSDIGGVFNGLALIFSDATIDKPMLQFYTLSFITISLMEEEHLE